MGSDKERYSIKLEVTFDCDPKSQNGEIYEYEITRNTDSSNNLSYFIGHKQGVALLLNDLDNELK